VRIVGVGCETVLRENNTRRLRRTLRVGQEIRDVRLLTMQQIYLTAISMPYCT